MRIIVYFGCNGTRRRAILEFIASAVIYFPAFNLQHFLLPQTPGQAVLKAGSGLQMRSGWKRENAAGHSWCIADWLALSFQSLWFRSGCATNEMIEENGAHTFLKCCRLIYEICCTFFFAHCRFTCRDGDKAIDPQEHRGLGGVGVGVLLIRGNVILVIEKWNSGEGMCKSWAQQGPKCPLPDGQPKSQILKDYAKSQRKHSDKSDLWWLLTRDRELPVRIRGGHNTNQGPTTAVLPTNSASW